MLSEALAQIRAMCDEALAEGENQHATTLSRLSSTIESAVRAEEQVARSHVLLAEIQALALKMIGDYLSIAKGMLSDAGYATFEGCLRSAMPKPRASDPGVVRLVKECEQVNQLLLLAIEGKAVGDCSRLGNLLAVKCKALRRAQIDAGELLTSEQLAPLQEPIVAAAAMARDLLGREAYDPLVDVFANAWEASHGD